MSEPRSIDPEQLILRELDGFIRSKVLMTAYRMNVFDAIHRTPMTYEEALTRLDLPRRSGTILLNACVGLGLLSWQSGRLVVPPPIAPFLCRGEGEPFRLPTYLIEYYDVLFADFVNLEQIVRTDGRASNFHERDYFKDDVRDVDPKLAAGYSDYMRSTMTKIAPVVMDVYDFSAHTSLLDLCGSTGAFSVAIARAVPGLRAAFLDVPAVAEIGAAQLERSDVEGRVQAIGGDVFAADFPEGVDVVTMCRSAHDWSDERVHQLCARVWERLGPGGRFLIIERMLPNEPTQDAVNLYVRAMYFLSKSETACYRPPKAYEAMLESTGFVDVTVLVPTRVPYEGFHGLHVVVGTKG